MQKQEYQEKEPVTLAVYLAKGGIEVINSLSNASPAQGPVTLTVLVYHSILRREI